MSAMTCKSHLAKHDVDHALLPILQLKAEYKPLLVGPGHSCFLGKPFYHSLRASNDNVAILHLQVAATSSCTSWAGANNSSLPLPCAVWSFRVRFSLSGKLYCTIAASLQAEMGARAFTCTSTAEDGAWCSTVCTATLAEGPFANSAGAVAAALILKDLEEKPRCLNFCCLPTNLCSLLCNNYSMRVTGMVSRSLSCLPCCSVASMETVSGLASVYGGLT